MPSFSKFIQGQRGSQQMVDTDGYIYSRKKLKDTALSSAWRCRKNNPPTKFPYLLNTWKRKPQKISSFPHLHLNETGRTLCAV